MYDDLEDSFGCDDGDDVFAGHCIATSKLKIVSMTIPDDLHTLEELVEDYYNTLASLVVVDTNRKKKPPTDIMIRRLCGVLWAMRPKPEFYTVMLGTGEQYVAIDGEAASRAMPLFLKGLLEEDLMCKYDPDLLNKLVLPKRKDTSSERFVKREKLFIWKDGKLVKQYFTYKTMNQNIRQGPKELQIFRERLRTHQYASIVSIDIEAYEWCHSLLLEIGVSEYFTWEDRIQSDHFVIEENEWRRNGTIVSDHRHKFSFNQTQVVKQDHVLRYLKSLFPEGSRVCLLGHNIAADMKYLCEADPEFKTIFDPSNDDLDIFDTQKVHKELKGLKNPTNLEGVLKDLYGKAPDSLHNAGNDARYTLIAMLKMAGVDINC